MNVVSESCLSSLGVISVFSTEQRYIRKGVSNVSPTVSVTNDSDLLSDYAIELPDEYFSVYRIETAYLITSFEPIKQDDVGKIAHSSIMEIDDKWKEVNVLLLYHIQSLNEIAKDGNSITMVIGVSNVGKSVYCRLLVNTLLAKYKRVAFLDMDVGQGEFTTEGVLSINIIDTPQFRSSTVPNLDSSS